jgi:hypothetical protein
VVDKRNDFKNQNKYYEFLSDDEKSMINFNLALTPEERLLNHQRALETINEIIKAREQLYGESKPTAKAITRKAD